ncbi:precorrin-2 C(20)-methyltransferase [Propionigenium maris DSM 9537]|uniref:Precorrin-2 C(20)-methyltransferase n=1 Tax=Propionigenium maris DSM 9537 TaxID=1123000 RepID=A0A9W6GIU8_9FUSO|nr:precorrin-2 C(20)-methyltransferase [Propionigenium maris]GLI54892.1 precorrin-2 C(20)-methyltransferase [Propionigenium maris DSM 9537]
MAKLYGIGVGVGDPELMTVKAVRALEESDVVILPRANTKNYSTAFEIAKRYMKDDIEKVFVDFTTVDDDKTREDDRIEYAKIVNKCVEEGKTMSFITIGDPMTFSTFVYVMELLEKKIEVESIPGITSFASVTSRLNTPLVMGDETLKIVPVSKDTDIVNEIETADNIIFMKVTRNLERLKEAFRNTGNMENVVLISNCGKESEKIFYNLEDITRDDISYFSTILLKKGGVKQWQKYTS